MLRRSLLIAGAVLYLATFIVGTYVYFNVEGSFPISTRYFWGFTALPAVILLAHLASGVLLLWKGDRAAPAAVAMEVLFLAVAVAGACVFWVTFRWVLLAAVARIAFTALAMYVLWWPLRKNRLAVMGAAGLGLLLAVVWVLTLRPYEEGGQPLVTGPGVLTVWNRPAVSTDSDARVWSSGLDLSGGAKVVVRSTPPLVEIHLGKTAVVVSPLVGLKSISMDGFFATRLNRVSLFFNVGGNAIDWGDGASRCTYVRCSAPLQAQSRLAEGAALEMLAGGVMAADFYARVDAKADAIDIVGLTYLRNPLYVGGTSLFTISVQPLGGQTVLVPRLGQFQPNEGRVIDRHPRVVNLQPGSAALYRVQEELRPPLEELSWGGTFDDYIVLEGLEGDKALIIYLPDWRRQALLALSPSAGRGISANYLSMESRQLREPTSGGIMESVHIEGSTVTAEVGRSSPAVRMGAGTYVNRMAIRLVPKGADYAKVVAGIQLWELPEWAHEERAGGK